MIGRAKARPFLWLQFVELRQKQNIKTPTTQTHGNCLRVDNDKDLVLQKYAKHKSIPVMFLIYKSKILLSWCITIKRL